MPRNKNWIIIYYYACRQTSNHFARARDWNCWRLHSLECVRVVGGGGGHWCPLCRLGMGLRMLPDWPMRVPLDRAPFLPDFHQNLQTRRSQSGNRLRKLNRKSPRKDKVVRPNIKQSKKCKKGNKNNRGTKREQESEQKNKHTKIIWGQRGRKNRAKTET